MTVCCPSCGASFSAPPGAAGHTVNCRCGAAFAVPVPRGGPPPLPPPRPTPPPLPPPVPSGEAPPPLLDFGGMGPLGRAALFLGVLGAVVALVGGAVWTIAASGLEREAWLYFRNRDPLLPYKWQRAYQTLDAAKSAVNLGGLLAVAALVLSLASANQQIRPRSTGVPILVASLALVVALIAFIICVPRS